LPSCAVSRKRGDQTDSSMTPAPSCMIRPIIIHAAVTVTPNCYNDGGYTGAMKDWAALIQAIAQLVGPFIVPILILIILWLFKDETRALLARFKTVEMDVLGSHVKADLTDKVEQLHEKVTAVESESFVTAIGLSGDLGMQLIPAPDPEDPAEDNVIRKILDLAATSPKVALIELSTEIERELRHFTPGMGVSMNKRQSVRQSVEVLRERGMLSDQVFSILDLFWNVRDRLVHGYEATSDEIVSALDSGLTLLKIIRAIPHEINVVYHPGVAVYADPACEQHRDDLLGLILESTSPGGMKKFKRIFPIPATATYTKGERVTWEWDMRCVVDKSWYHDPDTTNIKEAWVQAGMFAGRHLKGV